MRKNISAFRPGACYQGTASAAPITYRLLTTDYGLLPATGSRLRNCQASTTRAEVTPADSTQLLRQNQQRNLAG